MEMGFEDVVWCMYSLYNYILAIQTREDKTSVRDNASALLQELVYLDVTSLNMRFETFRSGLSNLSSKAFENLKLPILKWFITLI